MATQKVIKKSVSKSKDFKKHNKREIEIIKSRFLEHYGDAKTELVYHNIYELLVCVMLSAQCTDKRVNLVTPALFKAYPNVATLSQAHLEDVKILIQSVSFFNNKAKHLITMAGKLSRGFLKSFSKTT